MTNSVQGAASGAPNFIPWEYTAIRKKNKSGNVSPTYELKIGMGTDH